MNYEVEVTPQDFKDGKPRAVFNCAFVLAIGRLFPDKVVALRTDSTDYEANVQILDRRPSCISGFDEAGMVELITPKPSLDARHAELNEITYLVGTLSPEIREIIRLFDKGMTSSLTNVKFTIDLTPYVKR